MSLTTRQVAAQVHIDINGGNFQPMPIGIPDFIGGTPRDSDTAHGITQIITADLQRSGLFAPIDPSAYIEKITNFDAVPNFQDWRSINAQALITGRMSQQGDGRLKAEFRLWDVLSGQQLGNGQQYLTTPDNWRRLAHIIADAVYERVTGNKGYFDSRIVFVDETGPKQRRIKRLTLMDQDGANVRYLTRGDELVLTPRFSPSTQEITYMAYGEGDPRVYLLNLTTNEREIVGNFPGMSFSPRFSPDGQRRHHEPAGGLELQSVRHGLALEGNDTADRYAGDRHFAMLFAGREQICFASDRGGQPQIYVMPSAGGAAQRISFGEGTYSTPVWSPAGDYIAFTKQTASQFAIGVMRPDGSGERILTEGFHNEGPTFAPNGQVIMYFSDVMGGPGPSLYTINITGRNQLRVPTPSFASDPAWSPLLS